MKNKKLNKNIDNDEDCILDENTKHMVDIEHMSNFQLSRWAAMVEAVNLIGDKAEEKNIKFSKLSIKQPALKKYIDSIGDIICRKMDDDAILEELYREKEISGRPSYRRSKIGNTTK